MRPLGGIGYAAGNRRGKHQHHLRPAGRGDGPGELPPGDRPGPDGRRHRTGPGAGPGSPGRPAPPGGGRHHRLGGSPGDGGPHGRRGADGGKAPPGGGRGHGPRAALRGRGAAGG